MDNRIFECIAQRDDREKIRESKNVRAILAAKKQAIYLNDHPSYHGKTCTRKARIIDDSKEAFINDESKENLERKQIASINRENGEIFDDKSNFSDRSNHFTSSRRQEILPTLLTFDEKIGDYGSLKRKIPRPANAFMLFANEWRKKLATENPRESNKDISVRLGILWKNMAKDVKERYFALAREVDAEHKRKYPDYVYNPKEARLRKAMREQSRESSRRSILQNAIASARNGVIGDSPTTTTTTTTTSSAGAYLDHQQRHHLDCGGSNLPNFQGDRFIESQQHNQHHHQQQQQQQQQHHHQRPSMPEAWFQASKSGYATRGMDWYATSGMDSDVEQRSRLAMQQRHQQQQQQQQQQQRAIEKPSKEATRSQAAAAAATVAAAAAVECASAFSTGGYSPTFKDNPNLERELNRRQEVSGNYALPEFPDGQKWHPYQNNGNPHQHTRASHLSSQIGNVHRANGQETGFHGPWSQFCHGMPTHVPGMVRNVAIRGVRQAIVLRDRMPNRHCSFPEDPSRMSYVSRKHDAEDARSSYPPQEHQISLEPIVGSTPIMPRRREKHEEPKWEANPVPNSMSFDGLVSSTTEATSKGDFQRDRDKEYERRYTENFESSRRPISKQPLPGFHQAFGSTEIGRFSRSEYFVNMVGDKNTATIGEDNKNDDVSRVVAALEVKGTVVATTMMTTTTTSSTRTFEGDTLEGDVVVETDPTAFDVAVASNNNSNSFPLSSSSLSSSSSSSLSLSSIGGYCGQPTVTPWHSPHVGPIGSEI